MRKERQFPNKSSPTPAEEAQRQEANDALEIQNPEAFRIVLLLLRDDNAKLKIDERDGQEYAIVFRMATNEKVFMTKEPSEIAMLKDPVAGLQFLAKTSPLKMPSLEDDE